ncbi:pentatricopeptide repeat-containing protein At3g26630, chloroplastic-like [Dendrobium catenatum]|uniref:pentatricopeptide repeat-containing protein At3g26630, chloroplastic-like n=1 Tax=Dendrobium catenatum TaxID=906689 RepID=UPI0009F6DDEA|nr:pentatricopeptide repeat-containing protein At3g26630, chloroplastic-like [Dendrobium catenatum]
MDFFDMDTTRNLFEQMPIKNTHSYIAITTTYTHDGFTDEAEALFHLMRDICNGRNPHPNRTTIATIVSAFAQSESPSRARFLQAYIGHHGTYLLNDHNIAALIDLHSKCKNIDKSYNLFCIWKQKELVCYSAMIDGCGIHRCIAKAVKLFDQEIQEANSNEHPVTELYKKIVMPQYLIWKEFQSIH